MGKWPLFRFVDAPVKLTELGYGYACDYACFKLDAPLSVDPEDYLTLKDGQWFLNEETQPLQGKWQLKQ